jgi:hypothetical protein
VIAVAAGLVATEIKSPLKSAAAAYRTWDLAGSFAPFTFDPYFFIGVYLNTGYIFV